MFLFLFYLEDEFVQSLMFIFESFALSGSFRRVAAASIQCIKQQSLACFYDIKEINQGFLLLGNGYPTLTLQWCNVLILLNFNDQSYWSEVVKTPKKYVMAASQRFVLFLLIHSFSYYRKLTNYGHSGSIKILVLEKGQ